MIGSGLDSAACAFVGQALGYLDVELARSLYRTFKYLSTFIILLVMFLFYFYSAFIVSIYTDLPGIQREALSAVGLILMNIFPDLFKGMLKGIIKALGI